MVMSRDSLPKPARPPLTARDPVARTNLPTTDDWPPAESANVTSDMIVFSSRTWSGPTAGGAQRRRGGPGASGGWRGFGGAGRQRRPHLAADPAHGAAAGGVVVDIIAAAPAAHAHSGWGAAADPRAAACERRCSLFHYAAAATATCGRGTRQSRGTARTGGTGPLLSHRHRTQLS